MAIPTDRRHERAVSLLTDALRKPRIEALLKAWLSALDNVEEELDGFAVGTTDIDVAAGAQLRVLSRIVGSQEVSDDVLQRLLVRTRILVVRSSGTGDQLLRILNLITATPYLLEIFPATLIVGILYETTEAAARIAHGFMNSARSAGVRLGLLWSTGTEADVFTLADGLDDPEFDDETATQLSLLALCDGGLTPSNAWFGELTDAVAGALLSAAGGALADQDPSSLSRPILRRAFRYENVNDQNHVGPDAVIGEVPDASSVMFLIVFYLDGVQTTARAVCGKQDLFASPAPGWNVTIPAGTNTIRVLLAKTVGGADISVDNTGIVDSWNVLAILVDRSADLLRVSLNGSAVAGGSTSGFSFVNTVALRLGDSRINRADRSFTGEIGAFVIYEGAQVEGADVQAITSAVLVAIHDETDTDSIHGFADDGQTQGGQLLDIFGP